MLLLQAPLGGVKPKEHLCVRRALLAPAVAHGSSPAVNARPPPGPASAV